VRLGFGAVCVPGDELACETARAPPSPQPTNAARATLSEIVLLLLRSLTSLRGFFPARL
jgi:hypothetical protein